MQKDATPRWMIEQGFSINFKKRFLRMVNKTDSCWIWTRYKNVAGYGGINSGVRINGCKRMVLASRASWMIFKGPIPDGMEVCHNCPNGDNPACVNPDHLWLGTHIQNVRDAIAKGRHVGPPTGFGEKSSHHKLTQANVDEIRRLHPTLSLTQIANRFSVAPTTICSIIHRRSWNH